MEMASGSHRRNWSEDLKQRVGSEAGGGVNDKRRPPKGNHVAYVQVSRWTVSICHSQNIFFLFDSQCEKSKMKWHADSYFEIGTGHKVCQDYATHSGKTAVLSDGCSSMRDTDIGARLICTNELAACPLSMASLSRQAFNLGVSIDAFHGTRMRVQFLDGRDAPSIIEVHIEGDGYLIARHVGSGEINCVQIEFKDNAPWYPIYDHTLTGYHRFSSSEICLNYGAVFLDRHPRSDERRRIYSFDARCFDFVAVCSDGLGTFTDVTGFKQCELQLAKDLADVKIVSGEFIKRRIGALKRKKWSELSHEDDFSIAVLARSDA